MSAKYECRYCRQQFQKGWQVSIHIERDHAGEPRRLRDVSCWACAGWIDPNVTNTCSCGFVHPYIELADA